MVLRRPRSGHIPLAVYRINYRPPGIAPPRSSSIKRSSPNCTPFGENGYLATAFIILLCGDTHSRKRRYKFTKWPPSTTNRCWTLLGFLSTIGLIDKCFLSAASKIGTRPMVGHRIVVTGMAGAGKSTFSRVLSAKTGLPVICLDLHSWKPGWVRVPEGELLEKQRILLAGERWIVDSNDVNNDLLFERADTFVVLATPWWICSWRAFKRGIRRPRDIQLPTGCEESLSQRLRDEWGIVWRNWRNRISVRDRDFNLASRCRSLMQVHILSSKNEMAEFADRI